MDPKLEQQIDEFGVLADEIDRIKSELETKKDRFEELEATLRPILEALGDSEENFLRTKTHLVRIKKMGYDRVNFGYKEAFEMAMEKVNKATKKILEEAKEANKTTTRIVSAVGVQKLGESVVGNFISKVKSFFNKIIVNINSENNKLDKYNNILDRLSSKA